ncbi:MAG: penicillin-binding protein 1C [Elusimicrobiota bacterium]|jgi:penicillin-binding protein 1C
MLGPVRRSAGIALSVLFCAYFLIPKPPLFDGLSYSQAVYDRHHALLRLSLSSDDKYRQRLPLSRISPALIEAALLQEDRHFRAHPGVNPVSLLRAAWRTYVLHGRRVGGSTITMQVARLRYRIHSRTLKGKLLQILRAIQLERHYSKDELLEAYLNLVPYGGNIEGVGAAGLIYFKKDVRQLTLLEALTLSVIPKSPSRRTLTSAANAQADSRVLLRARQRLFDRWVSRHPEDAVHSSLVRLPQTISRPEALPFIAPHFTQSLMQSDPADAMIPSTLDQRLQRLLERQARLYIERKKAVGMRNVAALLVDARTMEVKASLGSADFFNAQIQGQVDGTRARRSPGSALKPFIYGLGFDQGLIHPMSMLKDSPANFNGYNPENFERDFKGPITVHDALIHSRNIPAIGVALQLKEPTLYEFLKRADIGPLKDESFYGLTLALGGAEVTLGDLARLYAMLANGGLLRPLRLRMDKPSSPGIRLLSPEACFMILDILKDNPRPAQSFRDDWTRDALPVYWKTGTSYAFRDAWTIGIFGHYVLAVWIGNFNGEGNPAFVGVQAAAPLFFSVVDAVRAQERDMRPLAFGSLENVAQVDVCAVSGQIPGPYCRHAVAGWFIPGKSPIRLCDIHREVRIDPVTGKRACHAAAGAKAEIYEFWPSDLLKIFRQAGIPRRIPPPDNPDCPLGERLGRGLPPQITSPERGGAYNLRAASIGRETIPFSAVSDADARELYWFVDEKFVGKAKGGESFFWRAVPGAVVVRVVDDQGRSDVRDLSIAVVQ